MLKFKPIRKKKNDLRFMLDFAKILWTVLNVSAKTVRVHRLVLIFVVLLYVHAAHFVVLQSRSLYS